jgi:hypothetical protein
VNDNRERAAHTTELSDTVLARRAWTSQERVTELETELDQRIERERIRELELASLRRELEVRFAYNATLEQRMLDHKQQLDWMHEQFALQAQGYAAELERVSQQLVEERARIDEQHRHADELAHELEAVRSELAAERARVSYRLVQRLTRRTQNHRVVFVTLRRTARSLSGDAAPPP